jgi:hypothetical protein
VFQGEHYPLEFSDINLWARKIHSGTSNVTLELPELQHQDKISRRRFREVQRKEVRRRQNEKRADKYNLPPYP